jgi:large repetitive protein
LKAGSSHRFDPFRPVSGTRGLAAAFRRVVVALVIILGVGVGRVEGQESITISEISDNTLCQNASFDVSITTTGTFNSGNIFTVELSDLNGNFGTPYIIGSSSGVTGLTISCTLPSSISASTGYLIRVVSNNPPHTSSTSGSITIFGTTTLNPGIIASGDEYCAGYNLIIGGQSSPNAVASGGNGVLTYSWEQSNYDEGLNDCTGNWTVIPNSNYATYDPDLQLSSSHCYRRRVTDECGATELSNIATFIIYPDLVSLTITKSPTTSIVCEGVTVSATLSGGGGGFPSPYIYDVTEYSINGGTWSTYVSGTAIPTTNLAGSNIQIRTQRVSIGVDGCNDGEVNRVSWEVADVPEISVFSLTNVDCYDGTSGAIDISISGGTAPFTYLWTAADGGEVPSSQAGNQDLTTLIAGTYNVLVTDANQCTVSQSFSITQPDALGANVASNNVTCYGANDGIITISGATGGYGRYEYSINGSVWQATGSFTGLGPGTYNIQVRDADHTGCVTFLNPALVITQPAALAATITSQTNVDCFGNATGSVTVAATAGTGTSPYQYSIDGTNFGSSGTFSTLTAGPYTITVRDANGCTTTVPVTITQPTALAATITSQTNVDCFGNATGSVTVAATAGTGTSPYQYSIDGTNFGSSGTFSTLTAGPYTITVRDANGCTTTVPVTITQPTALAATITSQTNVDCFGNATGSVTVAATAGTGTSPYQYSIDGTNFGSSGTFSTLTAGPYTITVRDANGCTTTVPVTITQPTALAATITSQTNVDCFGNATGSVTVAATAGTGTSPYQYSIDGTNFGSSGTFSTLTAGPYTITVRDANGCTTTVPVTITQPTALAATITSQTNVDCFGNATGSVTVAATAGTGTSPYQYSIDGTNFGSSGTFSSLTAGPYTITVRDANGCTTTVPVTITQPTALAATITSQTNVDCFGNATGSVTVAATAGTGTSPYQYSIDGTNFGSSGTFSSLTAGLYTITVRDANGCTTTVPVTITQPTALAATITSQTNVDCFGNATGSVTVAATAGTGTSPYQYSIDGTNFGSSGTFSTLTAGPYTITVRDANGCTTTVPVTITQPTALAATITSQTNVDCFGNATGSVTVTATAGTGTSPYQYSIDGTNFGSSGTFSTLTAGPYTITVRDANGCTTTVPVTITQPTALAATITSQTNVDCFGNATGSVTVAATAGTGTSPYQYSIDGTNFGSSGTFSTLTAGPYTITVRDANGCTTTVPVTITQPTALAATITSQTNVDCFGNATGSVTVAATAGTGTSPYQYSIDGTNFGSSGTFSTLTAGPYTITVRDANGCTTTVPVTITQPTALAATITSQTNVDCFGNATGSVTVAATAGTGTSPYQYSIDGTNFGSSGTFSTLTAGPYTITVRDANGCTTTVPVTITQPTALAATITSQTNVDCFGNATGSVTVAATAGTGTSPYQYSIDGTNFGSSGTFSSLTAGPYTITVRDANGCTTTVPVTITQPTALAATITSQTNVDCFGNATGSVTVAATAGTGTSPYQYSIDGTNFGSSGTFSSLTAGLYTITVRDANGCTTTVPVTITQPTALAATITSQTNVDCFGNATGSVTVAATAGTGTSPYQYSIDGTNFGSSGTFSTLTAGPYTITVRDANGCTTTVPVTITQPTALAATITSQTNVDCFGNATGSVTVTATAGTGTSPYQYSIDGTNFGSSGTFSTLTAGPYTITVRDANGCTTTVPVTITQPTALAATITSQTNVDCFGNATGSVTVAATAGTGTSPYQYSIDGTNFGSSGTFSTLTAGPYTITVRDANGCTTTVPVTITQPTALAATITSQTNVDCFGNATGSVTVAATAGTGTSPYQYSIDGTNFGSSGTFSSLTAGPYTITVRDANGCTTTVPVTITQPTALAATITSQTNVDCFGNATGSVTVAATAGTGTSPYQYSIDGTNFGSSGTFSSLTAGLYTITVRDANGCTTTVPVTITQPTALAATITSQTNVDCFGNATGSVTVAATAGTGTSPYQYSIDGTNFGSSGTFSTLTAGPYTITVRDANGCTTTVPVTITQPTALAATITSQTNVDCFGNATGSVTVTATAGSGTSPYQYSIDGTNFGSSGTFSTLTAGPYTITVRDANGCTTTVPVTITQPTALAATITSQTNVDCFGNATGSVTVAATAGTGTSPYQYSIDGTNFGSSGTFSSLTAGLYTITVRDANGCTTTVPVTITQPTALAATITSQTNVDCFGNATGSATVTAANGTPGYTYSWAPLGGTAATATGLAAGTYTVTVTDANLCTASISDIVITQPAAALSITSISSNSSICENETLTLTSTAIGGTPEYSYNWTGPNGFTSILQNPVITDAPPEATGGYTLIVKDINDCEISAYVDATITPRTVPVVTITASPSNIICSGTEVTFTSNVSNAGTSPIYQWTLNGTPIPGANSDTYTSSSLANGNIIRLEVTSDATCPATTTSSTITMTVNPTYTPVITIVASANPTCEGTAVTFSASRIENGGTNPSYDWHLDGVSTGITTSTFTTSTLVTGNIISLRLTSNLQCPATAVSNLITMTVNPNLPVSVSITADNNDVCAGTLVSFTATPINEGSVPLYQWLVNGSAMGTNSTSFTYAPANNDNVTVRLTSNATCATGNPATSNTITMDVNPILTPAVTIVASANPVCAGTSVTFTATPVNGGTTPSYQWYVNNTAQTGGSDSFIYTPVNGDDVRVVMTTSEVCVSSETANSSVVDMVVNPLLPVSVTVSASDNPICAGTQVTFTATPTNGGNNPTYQWYVDGVVVSGATGGSLFLHPGGRR